MFLGYILKKCGFFQKPSGAVVEASVRYSRTCTGVRIPISANSAKIKSKVFLELAAVRTHCDSCLLFVSQPIRYLEAYPGQRYV